MTHPLLSLLIRSSLSPLELGRVCGKVFVDVVWRRGRCCRAQPSNRARSAQDQAGGSKKLVKEHLDRSMSSCEKVLRSVGSSHLVDVDSCNFSERAFLDGGAPAPNVEAANVKRDHKVACIILSFSKHRITAMTSICIESTICSVFRKADHPTGCCSSSRLTRAHGDGRPLLHLFRDHVAQRLLCLFTQLQKSIVNQR